MLQQNSKRTFADIGTDVGLSATAVKRRVDRLEGDGVIVGYGARRTLIVLSTLLDRP